MIDITYKIDFKNRWFSIVSLSIGVPFFLFTIDEVATNTMWVKIFVGFFGLWAILDSFLKRIAFTMKGVEFHGVLHSKCIYYHDITKITIIDFERYPLIPFYFRVYYLTSEGEERFFDIRSRRYGASVFKILEEFKKREIKVIQLDKI